MSCEAYRELESIDPNDKLFYIMAYGSCYKQCPLCEFWVEKQDGCDHILCRCGFGFCYRCGGIHSRCECNGFSNYVEIKELKLKKSRQLIREAGMLQLPAEEAKEQKRDRLVPVLSRAPEKMHYRSNLVHKARRGAN
jgi:hypothetical protein